MTKDKDTCKVRVRGAYRSRFKDLKRLYCNYTKAYNNDADYEEAQDELNQYGLSFEYVAPGTFRDQRVGYFSYLLSTGGPQEEFRIYTDCQYNIDRVEFWFLDWFDGAKVDLKGKDLEWFIDFYNNFFLMCETPQYLVAKHKRELEQEAYENRNL